MSRMDVKCPACGEIKPTVRGERYPREPTSTEQQ